MVTIKMLGSVGKLDGFNSTARFLGGVSGELWLQTTLHYFLALLSCWVTVLLVSFLH
jgi:uncharacterized iron-regulated membrane protein